MAPRNKRYEVTIVRTITTVIEVLATNAQEAAEQIENYGIIEAANDYDRRDEALISKISKIVRKES